MSQAGVQSIQSSIGVPVTPANGGTGVSNPTAHAVAVAEGSSNFNFVGPGVVGSFLVGNGAAADPSFSTGQVVSVTLPAGNYTTLATDYVIGVNTSAPRTITLIGSPTTGQMYRIADITGSAATNNITVSGNGSNIDGAASKIINTNYGSIDVVYTGTIWKIV